MALAMWFLCQASATARPTMGAVPQRYAPGQVLVQLSQRAVAAGVGAGAAAAAASSHKVVSLDGNESVADAVKRLNARDDVEAASPDWFLYPQAMPNDPSFGEQWGLARIGAPAAWDVSTGGAAVGAPDGPPVTVCVIDSGIDPTQPDLVANLHPNVGLNAVDDGQPMSDSSGHGTHIAGIIAAAGNNGQLVAGVSWGGVKILACKFISAAGFGMTSKAITCIDYCLGKGSKVISASWTGGTAENPVLKDAVARAGAAGALVGFDLRSTPTYPAIYSRDLSNVITVAASAEDDSIPSFSNWDPTSVQLSAPGTAIVSTAAGGALATWSGTSMAAPFVAGTAALALAASGGTLTAPQLRQLLVATAAPAPTQAGKTTSGGILAADRALQQVAAQLRAAAASPSPVPSTQKAAGQQRPAGGVTSPSQLRAAQPKATASAAPQYKWVWKTVVSWKGCKRVQAGCGLRCTKVALVKKCLWQRRIMTRTRVKVLVASAAAAGATVPIATPQAPPAANKASIAVAKSARKLLLR
eukprot:scaffold12.g8124.t1